MNKYLYRNHKGNLQVFQSATQLSFYIRSILASILDAPAKAALNMPAAFPGASLRRFVTTIPGS